MHAGNTYLATVFLAVNLLVQWSPHLIELKRTPPFKDPGYVPDYRMGFNLVALLKSTKPPN